MENVLIDFRKLASLEFYNNQSLRLNDLGVMLTEIFGDPYINEIDGTFCKTFTKHLEDGSYQVVYKIHQKHLHFEEWYQVIESRTRIAIEKQIYDSLDVAKNEPFILYTLKELTVILSQIREMEVDTELSIHKAWISERVKRFLTLVKNVYLGIDDVKHETSNRRKLKWLGHKNILSTLFYELWKGQIDEYGRMTKIMLEVKEKQDLIDFIIENFVDEKGNEFKQSSLSDELSDSISKSKAKATSGKIIFKIP